MSEFDEVREQIEWAKTCIKCAENEIAAYIKSDAFALLEETDPQTGEYVSKIKLVNPVPSTIKGNLRNAIVDLKHSFDMALHAATRICGPAGFDKNFPWADSPTGVSARIDSWQRKAKTRLPEIIVDEILRQEPHATGEGFAGGNDLIREIANMANDKHSIGITASAQITSMQFDITVENASNFSAIEPWDAEKKELILIRHTGGSVSQDYPAVSGNVSFESVGRLGELPAMPTVIAFYESAYLSAQGFEAVARHA